MWVTATKLHLDLPPGLGFGARMDDDAKELVAQICTRIGMIMEDASVVALMVGSHSEEGQENAISDLEAAADRITALVAAAKP